MHYIDRACALHPGLFRLTKGHPLLNGQTPLQRARTPWGMGKVLSMLVALRYGGAA